MYRQYISQAEYDDIVSDDSLFESSVAPHCSPTTFHEPFTCAFCDGYYKRHPGFIPTTYTLREANGWGGNIAPLIDDEKAAHEQYTNNKVFELLYGNKDK